MIFSLYIWKNKLIIAYQTKLHIQKSPQQIRTADKFVSKLTGLSAVFFIVIYKIY